VGVGGLLQVRQRGLRAQEGAPGVDLVHQIEALHRRVEGAGEADGAGVVDQDIEAAKALDGLLDGVDDLLFEADIDLERQRLAAGGLDLFGGRVDGAG